MCFMLGLITDNHFGYENKPLREERLIFQYVGKLYCTFGLPFTIYCL